MNTPSSTPVEEKKYAQISSDDISNIAESVGVSDLSNDVCKVIASDATYRLEQVLQVTKQLMYASKRTKVTPNDFNRALKWMDVPPILGLVDFYVPASTQF